MVVRVRNNFHNFLLVRAFDFFSAFNIEEDCVGNPNLTLVCWTRWEFHKPIFYNNLDHDHNNDEMSP